MYGMKFIARIFLCAVVATSAFATSAFAQGPTRGRIEPPRDEAMEVQAKHNLEVARWYITKRKAYEGALDRLQEIVDTYADFSRMDEVVFLMGEANFKLGKKDKAEDFYSKLLKVYPDSEFAKRTRARLDELKVEPGQKTSNSKQ